MTMPDTIPSFLDGRVIMRAPNIDETDDYDDESRWEVDNLTQAHVATSVITHREKDWNGRFPQRPLLDIDIPVTLEQAVADLLCNGPVYYLTFDVSETEAWKAGRGPAAGFSWWNHLRHLTHLLETTPYGLTFARFQEPSSLRWEIPAAAGIDLVPTSTEGHHHLYIEAPVPHATYMRLLVALARVGILEPGYVRAAVRRGYSAGRLPWVKKGELVMPSEARTPEQVEANRISLEALENYVSHESYVNPTPQYR